MSTPAVQTLVTMLEALPEAAQQRAIDHMREYMADLADEERWGDAFAESVEELEAAARRAKDDIAGGGAAPFDTNRL